MKCPRCHKEGSFVQETHESIQIDRCQACNGVWLDEGELARLVKTKGQNKNDSLVIQTIEAAFKGIPVHEKNSLELCPKCSRPMAALNYAYSSGIIIDKCPSAHGIWLDHQELDKLRVLTKHNDKELDQNRLAWSDLLNKVEHKQADPLRKGSEIRPISYLVSKLVNILSD